LHGTYKSTQNMQDLRFSQWWWR